MKNVIIKRIIGVICLISMLFSAVAPVAAAGISDTVSGGSLIEASDIPLRLHYDEEAPYGNEGASSATGITEQDGWERWSLPIGNGYFGANVFGRTETERIQITEKTLSNPYYRTSPEGQNVSLGGLNNFSETYVDIGHKFSDVTDYSRWLDLKTAISGVSYSYEGVKYTREYFTSYPDKALVIRLDASEEGALSFVLRPTVPWKQEYASWEGDGASKTGQVISYVDGGDGIVELSGKMGYYDVDFLGIYRVVTNGGEVSATTCTNEYGEIDGTITVSGATGAYIYVTLGSDYELTSEVFTTSDTEKPTFDTTLEDARVKVEGEAKAIADQLAGKSFEDGYTILKNNHLSDYTELFGRVTLDLGDSEDAYLTKDELLNKYKNGDYSRYLETLYFQYGRYLLIECSRSGALPLNLQGTWNRYNKAPWGSGIWHNINEQMSYWHAFSTNLAETFDAYVEYNAAYMTAAEKYTTDIVKKY
ncbi:MAG: glycoside hydrolase family 95 protein, partial [Clostridia bacterium]|nr:glycoside hydrolase family 95 protein [Clostridia bacterium]